MVQNLLAFTATDKNYSKGSAGAITGERNALASALGAVKNKISNLKGDPAFFNFFDRSKSRLVLRQYNYTSVSEPNQIIDPQAANWTSLITPLVWPAIANLHGVATKGKWFYGTGYDLSKIAVIDMDNEYKQKIEYTFPADFNNFNNPYSDGVYHGEALTVAGDYLYALFYVNKGKGYLNYYDSIVAKFEIDTATGELYFESYVTVGKNTFTLDLYENKLYACSLGGMQQVGTGNADTNICIIDLDNFTQNGVVTVNIANPLTDGDIRDISIVNDDNVYVFAGHYGGNYTNFIGKVYHTSLANLTNPTLWTPIITVDDHGYLWGIYADGYRLWFVKGTPIAVYNGTPSTAVSADRTFSITDMSDYVGGNLNSACFIAPDKVVTRGVAAPAVAKSMASQIRLAREARELAKKLQEKDK